MCGICGFVPSDATTPVDRGLLQRMTDVIAHRGPDGEGFHLTAGVGLGVRRLAIVDLQTGDQPISNEDGTLTLICNGEIYNAPELRSELERGGHRFRTKSDVEVIVHLYEELGPDCLQRLRGMFAVALWDERRRRLLLACDRLGIKPLHYAIGPFGLLFGSEQKAILQAGLVERAPDLRALEDLFTFGFVVGPKTLFQSIRRLQPGHLLLCQDGQIALQRYWDPGTLERHRPGDPTTVEGWAEALRDKLDECVRLHLRSDVPVGAFLSPGLDSSSVVSLMSRQASAPVPVFSLGFDEPEADELTHKRTLDTFPGYNLAAERVVATRVDFELFPEALWYGEDPSAGAIVAVGRRLSAAAARRVKVVLAGEGADELFGGYSWFKLDRLLAPLARLPLLLRRLSLLGPILPRRWPSASRLLLTHRTLDRERYWHLIGPPTSQQPSHFLSSDLRHQLARLDPPDDPPLPAAFARWQRFEQLQHHEFTIRLPNAVTRQLDHHSMSHSLEVRVPFLDHELVELCARIPARLKLRGLQEKYILRRAMRDLLPPEIAQRPKYGLRAPGAAWLRGPLPDFATEALSPEALHRKGYFDPQVVTAMLAQHRRGQGRQAGLLMAVLGVQVWDDLFVHDRRPDGCGSALS